MIEILLSDPAIFLLTSVALAATAVSIVRDARTQREQARTEEVRVEI